MGVETIAKKYTATIEAAKNNLTIEEFETNVAKLALQETIQGFTVLEAETVAFGEQREEAKARVVGQDQAIDTLFDQLVLYEMRPQDDVRPAGSFVFVGPDGVGKNKTARVFAEVLGDGSGDNYMHINCSEFPAERTQQLAANLASFVVENNERMQRGLPSCVVGINNYEDACDEVKYLLYQLLGGIELTYVTVDEDTGEQEEATVEWGNAVLIFIHDKNFKGSDFGFKGADGTVRAGWNMSKAPDHFKKVAPRISERINEEVKFQELSHDEYSEVFDLQLAVRNEEYKTRYGLSISFDDEARNYLVERALVSNPHDGAHSLDRIFAEKIQRRVSSGIVDGTIEPGTEVRVFLRGEELVFGARHDDDLHDEYTGVDEDGFPTNVVPGEE